MYCLEDDTPNFLCISENCKAVHLLPEFKLNKFSNKDFKRSRCVRKDLKAYRKSIGLSQKEIAKKISICCGTLTMIDAMPKDTIIKIRILKSVMNLYLFYGELISNIQYGNNCFSKCKKSHFEYWDMFLNLRKISNVRDAAGKILELIKPEKSAVNETN